MYISYLDEAGLSKNETHLVVAGIVVKDDQLKDCEAAAEDIIRRYIPEPDREGFEFHAYELFKANGYFSDKRSWPEAKRKKIIQEVLDILHIFALPIIYGAIDKAKLTQKYFTPFNEQELAFMLFAERVNRWMASNAPFDACLLIADDTQKKKVIKSSLRQYRKVRVPIGTKLEKLENLADAILFADSCDTWGLQVADFCNYFIKRHLIGNEDSEKIYKYFSSQIISSRLFPSLMLAYRIGGFSHIIQTKKSLRYEAGWLVLPFQSPYRNFAIAEP